MKSLPITKKVQIINLKKFAKAALDSKKQTVVVYVVTHTILIPIYPTCKIQIPVLIINKVLILISAKYLDFAIVFSKRLITILLKHIEINSYTIDLKEDKQPFYKLIYILGLIELETLKIYIEIYLTNSFIRLSKFFASVLILIDKKLNRSLCFYINY